MYSYSYDAKTGGLILNFSPTLFSREPRPVYAPELDILGFDKYWRYERQSEAPYMWAEANLYYYRGALVAKLKGGNVFTAPEIIIPTGEDGKPVMPEPDGAPLKPVDLEAMTAANREVISVIEQTTVKRILEVYNKYKKRLDCFHVAFSGGKDSCVLLDLVKKALPKGSFVVVFGDTGMEFPDTYDVVRQTRERCRAEGIPFYIARSHLDPEESWRLFGPPSRTLRWCCSIHKSAPQTLTLREITGKSDYTGLAFVGVRAHESATRSKYPSENFGKKQRGQYSHNSILEWTSYEIWTYIFSNNILINNAYKKGSARVGCLCCPMGGGRAEYIEYHNYTDSIKKYHKLIENSFNDTVNIKEYIMNGRWSARKNGRDFTNNPVRYTQVLENGFVTVILKRSSSNLTEWIKTINIDDSICNIIYDNHGYYAIKIKEYIIDKNVFLRRLIKQVIRKSCYCIGCRVCEANCINGSIKFINNRVHISQCIGCHQCHEIETGCHVYHSLRQPYGGEPTMKSLNTLSNHAPKTEWLNSFFEQGNNFFIEGNNNLQSPQLSFFKRFLKDAKLTEKNKTTYFFNIISLLQWNNSVSLSLIIINLVNENPQIQWYTTNLDIDRYYTSKEVEDLLVSYDVKPPVAKSICGAFKRIVKTPFGTVLHFGHVTDDGELVRTKCSIDDSRVILYGLFKFAEKCNNYKEFTLATLLNDSIERDGISPTRIFGLTREEMVPLLLGLTANHPDFINASFTHDLEKITLAEDKTSQDVLALFQEALDHEQQNV